MSKITMPETIEAIRALRGFVPAAQLQVIGSLCRGEEGQFFRAKLIEFAERVSTMPKTYEQDGLGDDAVAYLHYFAGGCDWYITERDSEAEQHQAFGLADLGYGGEKGYISLVEICQHPHTELDLHFTPTRIGDLNRQAA